MTSTSDPNVRFIRVRGRVIPIRIPDGGSGPESKKTGARGRYKTKSDRQNEQRRERYETRKSLEAKQVEKAKWGSVDLFGSKYANTNTIGKSVMGGSAAAFAVWGGSRLIGKRAARMTNWKKLDFSMARMGVASKKYRATALRNKEFAKKTAQSGDIFSLGKAGEALKSASQAESRAFRLEARMNNLNKTTHYKQKKMIKNLWADNQAKVLLGTGAATAGSLYAREIRKK